MNGRNRAQRREKSLRKTIEISDRQDGPLIRNDTFFHHSVSQNFLRQKELQFAEERAGVRRNSSSSSRRRLEEGYDDLKECHNEVLDNIMRQIQYRERMRKSERLNTHGSLSFYKDEREQGRPISSLC